MSLFYHVNRIAAAISFGVLGFVIHKALLAFTVSVALNVLHPPGRVVDLSHLTDDLRKAVAPIPLFSLADTIVCDRQTATPYAVNSRKVHLSICGYSVSSAILAVRRDLPGIQPPLELVVKSRAVSVGLWTLIFSVSGWIFAAALTRLLENRARRLHSLVEAQTLAQASAQVAHDIRSPLSVLNLLLDSEPEISPAKKSILNDALTSINLIASGLLEKRRASKSVLEKSHGPAPSVEIGVNPAHPSHRCKLPLEQVLTSKKVELDAKANIRFTYEILFGHNEISIPLPTGDLKRIVSNLINNSVEAIEMTGFISVIATAENGRMLIEIRDSGIGIPQSVLTKIGANPFSHGKANGNGLGLYHAIHTVNHYGGELTVNSTPGRGTLVRLAMPFQVETPEAPAAPHSFK